MVTKKQLDANRANAKKGGVKTKAGKLVSRYNARTHGLLTRELLLPNEEAKDLAKFEAGIVAALKPQDDLQRSLVDTYVSSRWRRRRAILCERQVLESDAQNYFQTYPVIGSDKIMRYETALDNQAYRALMALLELQRSNQPEIQVEETQVD